MISWDPLSDDHDDDVIMIKQAYAYHSKSFPVCNQNQHTRYVSLVLSVACCRVDFECYSRIMII